MAQESPLLEPKPYDPSFANSDELPTLSPGPHFQKKQKIRLLDIISVNQYYTELIHFINSAKISKGFRDNGLAPNFRTWFSR